MNWTFATLIVGGVDEAAEVEGAILSPWKCM